MKIKIIFVVIFLSGLFFSASQLSATYYKYIDKSGNTVFTDDLSQVPEEQRESIDSYKSFQSDSNTDQSETGSAEDKNDPVVGDFEEQRKKIESEQKELAQEKERLLREQKTIRTPEQQEAYNLKVRKINKRIEAFRDKITEFNSKLSR